MGWHFYLLSLIFISAGIFHLIRPRAFMRIMPLYIPYHRFLVYLSGIAEILAGIGVFFALTRMLSLWAIIGMLVLFFPVHIHMLVDKKASLNFPKFILFFRLFLQFGLLYWTYQYM